MSIIALVVVILLLILLIVWIVSAVNARKTTRYLKKCMDGLDVSEDMVTLVVPDNHCNGDDFTSVDLSRFKKLKSIEVGNNCFGSVKELKIVGLPVLEKVVIGQFSFTAVKSEHPETKDTDRKFHLTDCPQVKELTVGMYSFSDYGVCEIKNDRSLEVVEIGELGSTSPGFNFYHADLSLKSGCREGR